MSAVPLLGAISLPLVQRIEHFVDAGFEPTRIAGLPGALAQRAARRSHLVRLTGVIAGDSAAGDLGALQKAAADGAELTFAADITAALELQKVVITALRAVQSAGEPNRFLFELSLAESPPLPPPAEVQGFGGLDDFGLGDLGFDTDVLGDLEGLAGDIADVAEQALDVIDQLGALANLDGLSLGAILQPMDGQLASVGDLAGQFRDAARLLKEGLG